MKDKKRIVILGAGYAGIHAAKLLNKKYKKDSNVEIFLIDKNPYHTLLTELHEVAGARVETESVKVSLKQIFNRSKVQIITDNITSFDLKNDRIASASQKYDYDYLVVGLGSEPATFGVPGVRENGFTIWSLEDAVRIREHVEKMFEKASRENNDLKRREMLTFTVAGAGFTGIETIGEFIELKDRLCRLYDIEESEVRLIVVEAMSKILPILNDKLARKSERYLNRKGVEVLLNAPITQVNKNSIILKDGRHIPTSTLIWTCGVQGASICSKLELAMGKRGRIQTNEYMQSVDFKNVYVVGDNAYYEEKDNSPMPQIVEAALQSAETAVHNISADMAGTQGKVFASNYHGFMVSIGSRYAVAELAGISLSGFLAMAMKHLVNLHYLFGIGSLPLCWSYIMHEFFETKDNRSMIGGHVSTKLPAFWLAILRVYVGAMWVIEGAAKVKEGWLKPGVENIHIVAVNAVSGATQTAGEAAAAGSAPLLSHPPAFFSSFMDTFVAPYAYYFQVMVVLGEIALGLALIGGLFTVLASLASIFLCINFILSAMAGKEILWYIFAAIALCGGAGRAFGLDYYVMPWLFKKLRKIWYRKTIQVNTSESHIDLGA